MMGEITIRTSGNISEIDMLKKLRVLIGAAACSGLAVLFVPGFAREIDAGVIPFSKMKSGNEGAVWLSIRQTQAVRTTRGRMDVTGVLLGENRF